MDSTFKNTDFFDLEKLMFVMECLARFLANTCKEGVIDVKYDNRRVDTEVTRRNMQRCTTWTKKYQKGEKALDTAQKHVGLTCKNLITPFKLVLNI